MDHTQKGHSIRPNNKIRPLPAKKILARVQSTWAAQRLKTVAPKLPISRETKIQRQIISFNIDKFTQYQSNDYYNNHLRNFFEAFSYGVETNSENGAEAKDSSSEASGRESGGWVGVREWVGVGFRVRRRQLPGMWVG